MAYRKAPRGGAPHMLQMVANFRASHGDEKAVAGSTNGSRTRRK